MKTLVNTLLLAFLLPLCLSAQAQEKRFFLMPYAGVSLSNYLEFSSRDEFPKMEGDLKWNVALGAEAGYRVLRKVDILAGAGFQGQGYHLSFQDANEDWSYKYLGVYLLGRYHLFPFLFLGIGVQIDCLLTGHVEGTSGTGIYSVKTRKFSKKGVREVPVEIGFEYGRYALTVRSLFGLDPVVNDTHGLLDAMGVGEQWNGQEMQKSNFSLMLSLGYKFEL